MDVYMEFDKTASMSTVLDTMKTSMASIENIEMVKPSYNSDASAAAIMTLRLREKKFRLDVVTKVCAIDGVCFAEEI
jgi:putative Mg2+ transporter-C (MgtC) family protein